MNELPDGLVDFVSHADWGDAVIEPIPGDASFRRYFRLRKPSGETAMLMHAPPPEEDPQPFILVAGWLSQNGMRAPEILAQNPREGWLLTEDFGNDRMREWVDANPADELPAYEAAIDALVALHQHPAGPFSPYDMGTYLREAALLTEWYAPAQSLQVDDAGYLAAWEAALAPLLERQASRVTVLRDYHAENIMLLDGKATAPQGLIDFQDALAGHRAYDLVSLLQDARRDVSPELEEAMLSRYIEKAGADEHFRADYARLGAQRNAKIVGIFVRLYKRDGKPKYLSMIPRVWAAMERDLQHSALEPVAKWFDANIPDELRAANGGTIA
ncbi:phosphotransferase [Erythrobacter sp. SCSIO 43205]|uniref:aminoglycoside phosphotransferase family protein n=1 Tax=Erythrobacter sp. SCSIO 43205 TaxID=2779361 RepID=UPI001CA87759|nr:phosphotransferase [Erythrobacter sp. SCSIO 43205]UAB76921.1 phosphotransferase [Erythrobacter sp. SCSIO 43205]